MFLVITGILQSIPVSVYEAAAMDGAGRWVTFRKITLPMIFSAVGPLLVGSFAFNINNFVGIYLLTGGGPPIANSITPAGETDILISYTYRLAFEGGQGQDFDWLQHRYFILLLSPF
jgi:maltose/maltodextrin transport system permease protein